MSAWARREEEERERMENNLVDLPGEVSPRLSKQGRKKEKEGK